MRRDATPLALILVLIASPSLAACGGDDDGEAGTVTSSGAPTEEDAATPSGDLGSKPSVEVPSGPPPDSLEVEEITEGDGEEAAPGDLLEVEYVGVAYDSGEEFDSSWERPEPFAFQLGAGMVIPGWDEGLEGMRAGGRRELTIPPDLAYGAQGAPPDIGPDETLVFVIDLVDVR